jgi:predicted permease
MNGLATDLRFALRLMRRQSLLSLVAFASLLVGIALNVLLFTISNAVLFRPLALREPGNLFVLLLQRPTGLNHNFSYPDYLTLRDNARLPEDIVAYSVTEATAQSSEAAEVLDGELVSGNMFTTLGVPIRRGRPLTPADDTPGAPPAVVVSPRLWQKRFGGGPLSGQTLTLNGQAFAIVGVVDSAFGGMEVGRAAEFWAPLAHSRLLTGQDMLGRPNASWLTLMSRLTSPSAADAARQELDLLIRRAFEARGRTHEPMVLEPGARGDSVLPHALASPLELLSVAAVLVLLVACMNVASLQLARADARRLELAVRAALGARRPQLVRLLLVDALLLSVCAGIASIGVVWLLKDAAASLIALFGRPVSLIVPVDVRVVMVALGLAVVSALIVGLFATWQVVRRRPADTLGDARSVTSTRRRTQQALVVAQFALSMAVLTGAALLVRTLAHLRGTDLGFESRTLALIEVSPGMAQITGGAASRYFETVIDAIEAMPGIQAAAAAHVMPLDFGGSRVSIEVAGYNPVPDEDMELNYVRITPGYFEALGIPVTRGRSFTAQDAQSQPRRIIVNETMAQRFWPDGQAVGNFVRLGDEGPYDIEVIGVVPDVHYRMVRETPRPSFYASLSQWPAAAGVIHVRTNGNPSARLDELRRAVAAVNAAVPVGRVHTLVQQRERNIARERMASVIGITLALATLLLAAAGLYSTMAFLVGRRTREIGVRVALGARAPDVRWMVLRDAGLLVILGAAAGLGLALWAGHALEHLLFGVGRTDVASLMASAALLSAAGLLASWIPARRASRVDPVVALRES